MVEAPKVGVWAMTVAQRRCAPTCENADGIEMKGGKLGRQGAGRQGALKLDWPPCQPHWSHPRSLCSPHPPAEWPPAHYRWLWTSDGAAEAAGAVLAETAESSLDADSSLLNVSESMS